MVLTKNVKISDCQKTKLLDYMNVHPEFAAGRLLGPLGRQNAEIMWHEVATMLNSDGQGTSKTPDKWKAVGFCTRPYYKLAKI